MGRGRVHDERRSFDPYATSEAKRLRVVRLIPVLDFGGVETTFALEAKKIDRTRIDFRVCTFWKAGDAAKQIEELGIPVSSLNVDPSIRNTQATAALRRYLRQEKPDILHASIGEANVHASLVRMLPNSPITILEEQGFPNRGLIGRAAHAAFYRVTDAIVGVSQASCDYLIAREWAPPSKVHLIYNAVADRFFTEPIKPRKRNGGFQFLSTGRLVEVKNHQSLIHAFARVSTRLPNACLTIVGEGPLRKQLEALVDQQGLRGRVSLAGYHSDVLPCLDQADAFVLPSLSEGFGIAAAEAMARGLPVIVSNAGALPEVVSGVGAEWVISPTDIDAWAERMVRLASLDTPSRGALSDRARQAAKQFTGHRRVVALQSLYQQLVTQR